MPIKFQAEILDQPGGSEALRKPSGSKAEITLFTPMQKSVGNIPSVLHIEKQSWYMDLQYYSTVVLSPSKLTEVTQDRQRSQPRLYSKCTVTTTR